MSDVDDRIDDVSDAGGDDLFGDDGGSGDDVSQIEDNDPIPSDDDMPVDHGRRRRSSPSRDSVSQRDDRSDRERSVQVEIHQDKVVELDLPRHGLPKTKDGNVSCVPFSALRSALTSLLPPSDATSQGPQLLEVHTGGIRE